VKKTLGLSTIALTLVMVLPKLGTPRDDAQIERGKYLAEKVAMCVQCHTPRDAKGELERQSLFKGAPIPVASPFPNQQWALSAPRIAGLPGWAEEDFLALLVTGSRPTGETPRPPMPPFRMTLEDAEAIAAYLKSLR
jgi:mono/diheme cytochrome c family protein